jgi:murein DD-endopeptidase MepM/ murein hydrolase activator NlpD
LNEGKVKSISISHKTFFIVIGLILALLGGVVYGVGHHYSEVIEFKDAQIYVLKIDQKKTIYSLTKEIEEITAEKESVVETLEESFSKFDLLTAVKNAGLTEMLTEAEIRDMLDLLDKAPYGSPFASGHWISSHYGKRDETAINGNGFTEGVDLVGKNGDTTLRAILDGVVIDHGYSEVFGLFVLMEGGDWRVEYNHLSKIYWQDVEKEEVNFIPFNKGDKIGEMGNTGLCWSDSGGDGSHVDVRMWVRHTTENRDEWVSVNPEIMIARLGGEEK